MNRAKRKARQAVYKQRSRDPEESTVNGEEPERKRIKVESKEDIAPTGLSNNWFSNLKYY